MTKHFRIYAYLRASTEEQDTTRAKASLIKFADSVRLLPSYYGSWRAIHRRFKNWSDKGVWSILFENTKDQPDMEATMIDPL